MAQVRRNQRNGSGEEMCGLGQLDAGTSAGDLGGPGMGADLYVMVLGCLASGYDFRG